MTAAARRDDETEAERELRDVHEQFAATKEILSALGRSGTDPDSVLDTIVERAAALCRADAAQLFLVRGDRLDISRSRISGPASQGYLEYVGQHPVMVSRSSLVGRAVLDRRIQQIPDVLADPAYGRRDLQRLGGYRTVYAAPMIVDGDVVGVLSLWRFQVDPFDERTAEVMEAFAAQAAIALKNVALLGALESRTAELATKVEELESLREVGDAVSSSLDLDEVLQTVVAHAVRITGTDGGSIMEYLEEQGAFSVRAAYGTSATLLDALRGVRIERDSSLVGQAALQRAPLVVSDLGTVPLDPHLRLLHEDGWRSVLAVPMLRRDRMVGALVIHRMETGTFGPDTLRMLETFAAQSSLAILNARLFRDLDRSRAALEVASRHKSEFLASMSHELRTPLNAVIGFSEVLLDQLFGEVNDRQAEYLADIRNSGRHLLELLNEILDLSRVEAGRMELEPQRFDVASVLEYSLGLLRHRAANHGISLELFVPGGIGAVDADELRFKQVVVNLLTNAVKFTPDGGSVTLAARRVEDELLVTVTDTGIGVPPEDRERIFESFQQGGRGAPKEEGTGLGLTLSRRIVELFGGRMWLQSEVGVGSTFGFSVPVGSPSRPPDQPLPPAEGGARPIVLIADDDPPSAELLAAYLDGSPVEVRRCETGEEALEAARREPPAALLLDIRLPGLDGWGVLRAVKEDPATAHVPVVLVTVVDEPGRGRAMGASGYLVKPVTREDLLDVLRRVEVLSPAPAGAAELR
jgi:signal transduction histidine kinase/ActR/RegA family two-component response regulator